MTFQKIINSLPEQAFDPQSAVSLKDTDPAFFMEVTASYMDFTQKKVKEIDKITKADSWRPQLADIMHALKSASCNVGAVRLASLCQTMENKSSRIPAPEITAALNNELQHFNRELTIWQNDKQTQKQIKPEQQDRIFMRILLVEDNPVDLKTYSRLITDNSYINCSLSTAASLKETKTALAEENFDIILCDLNLPDSKGLDTFYKLKKKASSSALVILSGNEDDIIAEKAVKNGAQDYLVKKYINKNNFHRIIRYAAMRNNLKTRNIQVQKLEGVLELAGAVCHELNQPLMILSGNCELLKTKKISDKSLKKKIDTIHKQALRMGKITNKLMRISRYKTTNYLDQKIIDIHKASE